MALIKCSECGKEISDKADKCPNCGCPVKKQPYTVTINDTVVDIDSIWENHSNKNDFIKHIKNTYKLNDNDCLDIYNKYINYRGIKPTNNVNGKKKDSTLSIWAIVLSLFGCTAPIAFILALVDLCKNDKSKRHIGSWFAIVIIVVWGSIFLFGGNDDKEEINEPTTEITTEATTEATTEEKAELQEPEETEEEYRESCQEYKFKDVLRNPEDYVGKRVKITIQISSVHEESILNATKYYFGYSENEYGYYGDCYAIFDERENLDPKLLSEDVITVYGEIAEPEYTSSLILNSEEVFSIKMKYVDLIDE